jgi:glycosyltransferase involved in cell wall biosynthesis
MGRLYTTYHDKIEPHCKARGYVHRFSSVPWQHIFPTEEEFYRAIADSKISICFPRCTTHPELAGDVETMTLRYLESIACKCVAVGHCPTELRDLFGYNPILEADMENPGGQLDHLLHNLELYAELLDRNYQRLLEVATWDTRARQLGELLRARGYRW